MKRRCVYAGSFDPPTFGHLWMVLRGVDLFDSLIVAIGLNSEKKNTFSVDERLAMLRDSLGYIHNVTFDSFTNKLLVNYASSVGAKYILRGIRSESDYGYEKMMRHINNDLNPDITTVFLQPPREVSEISSSLIKGLVGSEGWEKAVGRYVPNCVLEKLIQRKGGG